MKKNTCSLSRELRARPQFLDATQVALATCAEERHVGTTI